MSKANARRLLRPHGLAVVLGMGALSVALVGATRETFGGSLPALGELAVAGVGMIGGAKAVLAAA
ncbi:hypothetical protein GCM10010989_30980 [Croceicoccus pelagius]|uniref:Uncharacterized protein n=2 Tax=Croceicoccus pelagius TaxID=1703341 RepID=A0A917DNS0_9SPHN|nr:hypothetical protein GCM10010989_30980 [Croceicoccus pelagius]